MSQKSVRPTAGSSGATASTQARRRVLLTIRELDAATEEASHLLVQSRRRMRRVNQQIERGMSALDVTYSTGMSDQRATLNAAMTRIEKARHEFHRAMFLLAEADGHTKTDIARAWGVSRQWVSHVVRGRF
jgi:Homeodomain-like domain